MSYPEDIFPHRSQPTFTGELAKFALCAYWGYNYFYSPTRWWARLAVANVFSGIFIYLAVAGAWDYGVTIAAVAHLLLYVPLVNPAFRIPRWAGPVAALLLVVAPLVALTALAVSS